MALGDLAAVVEPGMSRGSANKAAGKALEQWVARRFGEARHPADTGGVVDNTGTCVWQCKHVQNLSLSALAQECLTIASHGILTGKPGVVCAKVRQGRGYPTEAIVAMTEHTFEAFLEAYRAQLAAGGTR